MSETQAQTRKLSNFEELNDAVRGARSEVVQLEAGRVHGFLSHISIAGLPVNFGEFSIGMRSRGVLSDDRITVGMLTTSSDRVTHWSHEMFAGDILVTPPGVEHEGRYFGAASFATISLTAADISSIFGGEARMRNIGSWNRNHYRAIHNDSFIPYLCEMLRQIRDRHDILDQAASEFWKSSIIEAMTTPMVESTPSDHDGPLPSALKVVRKAEDLINSATETATHVSKLCSTLNVSRRTLHRAFHDTLGMGPVTFLRRRRLCAVHTALRNSDPRQTTIANIALQHGFLNLGRFSEYYHAHFGEYPSQTLRSAAANRGYLAESACMHPP